MTKKFKLTLPFLLCSLTLFSQPKLELELYKSGFDEVVDIANAGDARLFIVERAGVIKIIDSSGSTLSTPFLDIADQVEAGYVEQGLLGLAFAPDYTTSGDFYVCYIDNDENTVVSRFKVSTFDENVADEATEQIVYTADQPFVNHNGGDLAFGPDGYLYIGLGDGGSAGDPGNRAQDPEEQLGKMHRIDVNGTVTYVTPTDNPFYGSTDTLETIWDIGLRNPWRYSFDRLTGDLWIGDVGQDLYEEVDFEPAATGGFNYGWKCYEADDEFAPSACEDDIDYTFPVFQYSHSFSAGGFAIVGGYVYRGSLYPGMYGYYIFGDNVSDNWWTLIADGSGGWTSEKFEDLSADLSTFGESVDGEIYCAELYTGRVYHVIDACGDFAISAVAVDYQCGVTDGSIDLTITSGTAPYEIEWSNGSSDEDISALEPGTYSVTVTDDSGCEHILTVIINDLTTFTATITADGPVLTANDGVSWQWYLEGEAIAGATGQTYTPTESGNYTVEVTDVNNCTALSEAVAFTYVSINMPVYVQNIQVYPNPVKENIIIGINTTEILQDLEIFISDATGRILYTEKIHSVSGDFEKVISAEHFADGIYHLSVKNEILHWQHGFVVNH